MVQIKNSNNEKLKQTALYIISQCYNKDTFGLKVLHKLLYFSDFAYYKKNHTSITGGIYKRFEYGPMIPELYGVLSSLESEGKLISKPEILSNGGTHNTYEVSGTVDISTLSIEEKAEIDRILSKLSNLNGKDIENLSHKDVPWQVTDEGDVIDYDLVFYRDDSLSAKVE